MKDWKKLLGTMRLPFVVLAPVCALVGLGAAYSATGRINWFYFALAFVSAVSAHISVNVFNEYFDFRNGLDSLTHRTPFSGGSGTLQIHPALARRALLMAWIALAIPALIGIYFTMVWGWMALPLGACGLFLLYGYTKWIVKNPVLCLLAPGLGFGPLIVLSTNFALTGSYSIQAIVASLIPFFLVNDLLLLNQFPDLEADRSVDRHNLPIAIGRRASGYVYIAFLISAFVVIALGVLLGFLPRFSLIGLLTLVPGIQIIRDVLANSNNVPKLIPAMGQNVVVNLATPVLLTIGLFMR
jgi:1,4-dihydroxy-2-naphthoate octaprenyltransferase